MPENRILLVENEATSREIITEVLRGKRYSVDSVATAGAASTCLQAIPYALVIADWVLPDGDGIDVADAAAQLGSKTVVITGNASSLPSGTAERHQVFAKPLSPVALVVTVRAKIGAPEGES
jgi:DNA-binding response OmpR family regulator